MSSLDSSKSAKSITPEYDPKFTNSAEVADQKWNYLKCTDYWLPGEGTFITHQNHRYLIGPSINLGINGHIHYCYKYPVPSMHRNAAPPSIQTVVAKIIPNTVAFEREIKTIQALQNCKNVVKLHTVLRSDKTLIFITDLAQFDAYTFFVRGNSRKHNLYKKYGWDLTKPAIREYFAKMTMANIIMALQEMKAREYIHCDIKLSNMLLFVSMNQTQSSLVVKAKLTDFGHSHFGKTRVAKKCLSNGMTRIGTVGHVAPELFEEGKECDYKVDVWALGIAIFSMLIPGHLLYGKYKKLKALKAAYDKWMNLNPWSTDRPTWFSEWEGLSPEARDLIFWMTRMDAEERPNYAEILRHPWFVIGTSGHRKNYKPHLKYFDMLGSSTIAQE